MRIKRGKTRARERRRLLKRVKGYRWGRKNRVRLAKTAVLKAGVHAYRDRRLKKQNMRTQWQIQINAAVRPYGFSYSRFLALVKKHDIALDRKMLAYLAEKEPKTFRALVDTLKPKA